MIVKLLAMLATFAAGAMIAFQSPINAKLGSIVGGPLVAAFFSFCIGTLFLGTMILITKQYPDISQINRSQFWLFIGGFLGAGLVFTTLSVVPILGSTLMIAILVMGQMTSGLFIDKIGFLLPQAYDISLPRIIGAILVIVGVILIARSTG